MADAAIGHDAERWREAIRQIRSARGWSQSDLARELAEQNKLARRVTPTRKHIAHTVYAWEAGQSPPGLNYGVLLVLVFATSEELAEGSIEPESDLDRLMTAFAEIGAPMDRRKLLLNAAAMVVVGRNTFRDWPDPPRHLGDNERVAWALRHPSRTDPATVRLMQARVLDLLRQTESRPPHELLPEANRWLAHHDLLRSHARREHIHTELATLEALAAAAAGQAAQGLVSDPRLAAGYYQRALAAAEQTGPDAGWLVTFPAMHLGALQLYRHGDPKTAQAWSDRAITACDPRFPTVAAEAYARRAEVLAGQRDQHSAQTALDQARTWADHSSSSDPLHGLFPQDRADGFEASVWMLLHQPAKAVASQLRAVTQLRSDFLHRRAWSLSSLAYAYALVGEVEHACATAHEALDVLQVTQAAGGLWRAREAVRELRRRAPDQPCVVELTDRLLTLPAHGQARVGSRRALLF